MIELAGKHVRVRFGAMGRVRCEPGWHLEPEWAARLRDYDLWFVWAGSGRMVTREETVALGPGSVFWMRPGRRYEAGHDAEARLGVTYVHFDLLERGRGLAGARWTPPAEVMRTRHVEFMDSTLRRVLDLARGDAEAQASAERLFGAVLAELMREQAEDADHEPGVAKHHREVAERVAANIRESPGEAGSVAELAEAAGYSTDHFTRIFTRVIGEGPQEFVINEKMKRARCLLAESSLTVGMIAEALGFRDVFFFSRQFRQRTGRTPTDYRREGREG